MNIFIMILIILIILFGSSIFMGICLIKELTDFENKTLTDVMFGDGSYSSVPFIVFVVLFPFTGIFGFFYLIICLFDKLIGHKTMGELFKKKMK